LLAKFLQRLDGLEQSGVGPKLQQNRNISKNSEIFPFLTFLNFMQL
jgi:hypothetical protein